MGARIETVSTAGSRVHRGYLRTASKAIRRCLNQTSIAPEKLGMMINTGVYPDKYVQEPAFAALIQGTQKTLVNPLNQVFSFDLHGGGGMIMAMRILDGFLASGKISGGIIVAGDSVREKNLSGNYRYDPHAGAVLLVKGGEQDGFVAFDQDTYAEYMDSFNSSTKHVNGKLITVINQSDKYFDQCIVCAKRSVEIFLDKLAITTGDIDLVITSQDPPGLPARFGDLFRKERVMVANGNRKLYSAGLVFALERAIKRGMFFQARNVLFLTVGAGITVNLALYVNGE